MSGLGLWRLAFYGYGIGFMVGGVKFVIHRMTADLGSSEDPTAER